MSEVLLEPDQESLWGKAFQGSGVSSHELRLKGCREPFRRRGLSLADDQVRLAQFKVETAYEETRKGLGAAQAPTAILSLSNLASCGRWATSASAALVTCR